jgi:hypothetical protein
MALRPKDLQTSTVSLAALEAIVREQLQMVDDRIRGSDRKMGENIIIVDLPEDFGIPGLEKREQQRFVYSKLVQNLKQRDWNVRIFLQAGEPARLYIKYVIEFNKKEISAMTDVLKEAQITSAEIEEFCNPKNDGAGREAAPTGSPGQPPTRPPAAHRRHEGGPAGVPPRYARHTQPPR